MAYGILAFVVLVLDVYAISKVSGSSIPAGERALWSVLIVLLPVVGFAVWALAGPRQIALTT